MRLGDTSGALPVHFRNTASIGASFAAAQCSSALRKGIGSGKDGPEKATGRRIGNGAGTLNGVNGDRKSIELERLRELCGEFEGLFLAQIMRIMQHSVLKSGFLHGGIVEEIFTDQLCMAIGKQAGKRASLGLAKMLYERLARVIEADAAGAGEVHQRYVSSALSVHSGTKSVQEHQRSIEGTLGVLQRVPEVYSRNVLGTSSAGRDEKGVRASQNRGS